MSNGIANVVSFCQPLGTSETVGHNVLSSRRLMYDLPELPQIPIDCNVDPPTCPLLCTDGTTTPGPDCGTIPTPPDGGTCIPCIPSIPIAVIAMTIVITVFIWKRSYFKDWLNSSKPHDNESISGTNGPHDVGPQEVESVKSVESCVELHARSTDVEPPPHRYEEIGNAAPVQPESKLLYETNFGNVEGNPRVELHVDSHDGTTLTLN